MARPKEFIGAIGIAFQACAVAMFSTLFAAVKLGRVSYPFVGLPHTIDNLIVRFLLVSVVVGLVGLIFDRGRKLAIVTLILALPLMGVIASLEGYG
jgi:hypothetical protein